MTTVARRVLEDCQGLLEALRADPRADEWRRLWILTVALLRSVGYVLKNADAAADTKLSKIVERKWSEISASRPEPEIFWEFIDRERHNILKDYQVNAGISVTVRPGTNEYNLTTGQTREVAPSRPTQYDYVVTGGVFEGMDQRDLVGLALEWWEAYLLDIESEWNADDA